MVTDDLPLAGIRILDLTVTLPGPFTTQTLRRLGAAVTRVEPPAGDPLRHAPNAFAWMTAGKETVVADLKDPADRERILARSAEADVVIEGWRPGVAERLGVGPADVHARNPAAVYCSLTGFGPGETRAGHDITYAAAAGALDLLRPERMPVGDLAGGSAAATTILAELLRARTTGRGRAVHVSIAGTLADWVAAVGGREVGDLLDSPTYRVYPLRDGGRVAVGIVRGEQRFVDALVAALGTDDLAAAFAQLTADEVTDCLGAVDTSWAIVTDPGR